LAELLPVVLATRNPDKIREVGQILASLPIEIQGLGDFKDIPEIVEDRASFEANAIKKALKVWEATGLTTLADDSGLEVDALDGQPGIRSARFAGESASYQENNLKLLDMLKHVPPEKRTARFVCAAVLVTSKGKIVVQRGEIKGLIVDGPRGEGGFGYDPIFYIPRLKQTVAELDEETKNSMSHRAKAFEALRNFIVALCLGDS
jgi:XTP/dITP diphosphohydrolase